jgi:hypothetical protein
VTDSTPQFTPEQLLAMSDAERIAALEALSAPQHATGPSPEIEPMFASPSASVSSRERQPVRLDPAKLRAKKAREREGYDFILHATTDDEGHPTIVRVRRPSLFDADELLALPTDLQNAIFTMIEETEQAEGKQAESDEGDAQLARERSLRETFQQYGNVGEMAKAYCLLGFLEPRCYATAEEADANGGVWVRDIEMEDRIAFLNHCTETLREASATVVPFRGRPDGAVDPRPAGAAVSGPGEPEPDFEDAAEAPRPGL